MRRHGARAGFTLTEILVAAGLIGVVMAMAMQAFMGLTRISETTRSQIMAQSEASKGVHAVAALLRRAHVIYFTGRPLNPGVGNFPAVRRGDVMQSSAGNVTDLVGDQNVDPLTLRIPSVLGATGPGEFQAGTTFYNFTAGSRDFLLTDAGLQQYNVSKFRFWDWGADATTDTLRNNERLRTQDDNPAATRAYDRYFSSPLMYIAEAELATDRNTAGNQDGTIANMFLPLAWTFHIVYLAPMNIKDPNRPPSWISTRRPMDRAAAGWNRSTIPFELRVLTIPGVEADMDGVRQTAQRVLADGTVPKPPYDYVANSINYHPVPINWETDPAVIPKSTTFSILTSRRIEPAPAPPVNAGGPRVRAGGAVPHPNYNNIGNDPPTNEVLSRALLNNLQGAAQRPRDVVLASYIDPDSVHGTCVRLLNTLGVSPHAAAIGEAPHNVPGPMGVYRKYLNAYGGEFLYNHYAALMPNPLPVGVQPWDVTRGASIPRRALVSVSTRFRTDSRVKFNFATETIELDLENVVRFQTLNGSMNL
jgi:prepilin-type N-terminal cleavage/methylation domain-containing protein